MEVSVHRVLECIQRQLKVDRRAPVTLDSGSRLRDFLDSFSLVQLVVSLEDEFLVKFTARDLVSPEEWETPDSVTLLLKKVAARHVVRG